MALTLYSYRYSVYARAVRMGLHVCGLDHRVVEVDPFDDPTDPALAHVTPFGKVPVLDSGDGLILTETAVILRYLARIAGRADLIPTDPVAEARMGQAMAVMDAEGYWPMVRLVYSHGVFGPATGEDSDPDLVADGLADAAPVLALLETIAAEGHVLADTLTLADLHLAPMIGAFAQEPQARAMLDGHPALARWLDRITAHPAWAATHAALETRSRRE